MKENHGGGEKELSDYTEWCKRASYFLKEARFVMDDESIEKCAQALISAIVAPNTMSENLQYQQTLEKIRKFLPGDILGQTSEQELEQGQARR